MMKRYTLLCTLLSLSYNLFGSEPSSLNTAFNGTGTLVITSALASDAAAAVYGIAQQPINGATICVGLTSNVSVTGTTGFVMSFDANGTATNGFSSAYLTNSSTTQSGFNSVVIQPNDNKIVTVGYQSISGSASLVVARYLPNGLLDTVANGGSGFGSGTPAQGYYALQIGGNNTYGVGATLQPNGYIVATGNILTGTVGTFVARFTPAGVLDTTFATPNGYSTLLARGSNTRSTGITLQSNGKILITGANELTTGNTFVARYTTAGILDSTFGSAGYYQLSFAGYLYSYGCGITTQADDQILIAGWVNTTTSASDSNYMIARITQNGTGFDTNFNGIGYSINAEDVFFNGTSSLSAYALAIQPNQQIVTCGRGNAFGAFNVLLARYNQDGTVDPSCVYQSLQSSPNQSLQSLSIGSNGIIMSGGTQYTTSPDNNLYISSFLGGQTPSLGVTSEIGTYGYTTSTWLSEFLYVNFYAQCITDEFTRDAVIASVNDDVLSTYTTNYANQPSFNFITNLSLVKPDLIDIQIILLEFYPESTSQINQFFTYLNSRITALTA
jgi:uncharacterized delta-60 repeat protein